MKHSLKWLMHDMTSSCNTDSPLVSRKHLQIMKHMTSLTGRIYEEGTLKGMVSMLAALLTFMESIASSPWLQVLS